MWGGEEKNLKRKETRMINFLLRTQPPRQPGEQSVSLRCCHGNKCMVRGGEEEEQESPEPAVAVPAAQWSHQGRQAGRQGWVEWAQACSAVHMSSEYLEGLTLNSRHCGGHGNAQNSAQVPQLTPLHILTSWRFQLRVQLPFRSGGRLWLLALPSSFLQLACLERAHSQYQQSPLPFS